MRRLTLLALVAGAVGVVPLAAAAASPRFPLDSGEVGPRCADAKWSLTGRRPAKVEIRFFAGAVNRRCDLALARATRRAKYRLGFPAKFVDGRYGPVLRDYLLGRRNRPVSYVLRAKRRAQPTLHKSYPLARHGALIGFPFSGTHRLGNYQSDNALDIACSTSTPVLAPIAGRLFGGYGRLGRSESRFLGLRINMVGSYRGRTVAFYLAHMDRLFVPPGARVRAGQPVGSCGSANGIFHLHIGASYRFPIQSFVAGRY